METATISNNKRIAKNTIMLYIRMLILMLISLYTSRVVLQELGVVDFGIYNIVGGVIVLFSFINGAMVTSIQRFLNYELGRNNMQEAEKIFAASINIYLIISILFLIISETVGIWFLNAYIKIPIHRINAANWVFQLTIIATILNTFRAPYNAVIIAYEKMTFYAYTSIIEAGLKLGFVYLIIYFSDRLISYAFFLVIVSFIILIMYIFYCYKQFRICRKYDFCFNRERYQTLVSFSGWSLLGSITNMGAFQGISILLNIFFGVKINAAMGIANQVNNAVYHFVSNFQTAFNPQLVKLYASKQLLQFQNLVLNTSRYSYYLLLLIALPLVIYCEDILGLWLRKIPEYAIVFCKLLIISSLFDALSGPLWMSVQAYGKIRIYQIIISLLLLSTLIIAWIAIKLGGNPTIVIAVKLIVNICVYLFRLLFCYNRLNFPIKLYLKKVVSPCLLITILSLGIAYMIYCIPFDGIQYILFKIPLIGLAVCICIYIFGLFHTEKVYIAVALQRICFNKK